MIRSEYLFLALGLGIAGLFMYKQMKRKSLSQAGLDAIKAHEGWRPHVYLDQADKPTIGYGHLIKPGEHFTSITKDEGERLLNKDIYFAVNAVNDLVNVELNQNQFDALVSFVYNVGRWNFADSTLLEKLNAGDYDGAGQEFKRWNKITRNGVKKVSQGLANRRKAEELLYYA